MKLIQLSKIFARKTPIDRKSLTAPFSECHSIIHLWPRLATAARYYIAKTKRKKFPAQRSHRLKILEIIDSHQLHKKLQYFRFARVCTIQGLCKARDKCFTSRKPVRNASVFRWFTDAKMFKRRTHRSQLRVTMNSKYKRWAWAVKKNLRPNLNSQLIWEIVKCHPGVIFGGSMVSAKIHLRQEKSLSSAVIKVTIQPPLVIWTYRKGTLPHRTRRIAEMSRINLLEPLEKDNKNNNWSGGKLMVVRIILQPQYWHRAKI